jgi:hypothetical protein
MQTSESSKALTATSLAVLAVALTLFALVLERLSAAMWQWYKFSGYSDDGHITLSFRTGLYFSAVLASTFGIAFWLNRTANREAAPRAVRWSFLAMCVAALALVAYWLLGASSLNVWRA